jgi:hypothetical protein
MRLSIEAEVSPWLSTPRREAIRGRRKGSHVASTDDIHTPVENSGNNHHEQEKTRRSGAKPPGQFVSDELAEQTARFLEDVKGLAKRRKDQAAEDGPGPPPRGGQRSSRR